MPGFSTGGTGLTRDQRRTFTYAISSSEVRVTWVGWLLVALAFLLSPAGVQAQGQYTATALYNFCPQSGCPDGGNPTSPPLFDTHGNIYGVASIGGANNKGVVYRVDPEWRHVERKCALRFLFAIQLCRRQRSVLFLSYRFPGQSLRNYHRGRKRQRRRGVRAQSARRKLDGERAL